MIYKVLRHMIGDKEYQPGDTREMLESEAAPLLASGAIKAVGAPKNKAESGAPKNKADGA